MEIYNSYSKKNPQSISNPITRILLNWVRRYVVISKKLPWQQELNYPLLKEDLVSSVKPKMEKQFKITKNLLWTSLIVNKCEVTEISLALVLISCLHLSTAFFLAGVVRITKGNPSSLKEEADKIAINFVCILMVNLLKYTLENYYRFRFYHLK